MIGIGGGGDDYYKQLGLGAMKRVADLQRERENVNSQKKAQHTQNIVGGVTSGAAIGTEIMPGWGTAIGAVVGGLAGNFL